MISVHWMDYDASYAYHLLRLQENFMRPMYENQKNLSEEKKVADLLSEKWKCNFRKMPIKYELDYVLMRDLRAVAFCEIKCRTYSRKQLSDFGGSMISLAKFMKAKELNRNTSLPVYIIIQCTDQLMYCSIDVVSADITWSGRKDRGDVLDHEPYCLIANEHFIQVD